ncbi:MAG: ice-binding family protein [Patescibacteria group bacterium]
MILSKTGISTTGATAIVGDLGVSPAAATYITGFALTLPAAGAFSSSAIVTGKVYAPGYADPTPANLSTAVGDMQTAYTDGAGRAAGVTELSAGNIGGLTFAPNVYKWGTSVTIPTDITLSGSANDVWIFQIAQNLDVSSAVKIVLAGGAKANNIFWVVAGQTIIGTTAVFNGNILDQTAIVLNTGATLNGRALAQTAATLDSNAVTIPTSAAATPATPATPAVPATPASNTNTPATPAIQALQNELDALLANINSVRAQIALKSSASAFGQQVKAIVTDLNKGSKGDTVNALQQFLISQGKGSVAQALAKNGATPYFGDLTREALAEFQKSVGITPASGYFGAKTRAYINSLIK